MLHFPKDFTVSKYDRVVQFRLAVIFLCAVAITFLTFFGAALEISVLIGVLGGIVAVLTFFEPIIIPVVDLIFRQTVLIRRLDIYKAVIEAILTANEIIRFRTPTTSWGIYSEGLKVFHETMQAIQQATSQGKEVRIIADIWDWEKAVFAEALQKAGAVVRHAPSIHDYYLIKDESVLITMGTDITPLRIEHIGRSVRRLSSVATISRKDIHIHGVKLRFDEEWQRLADQDITSIIEQYSTCGCPNCGSSIRIKFEGGRILTNSGVAAAGQR